MVRMTGLEPARRETPEPNAIVTLVKALKISTCTVLQNQYTLTSFIHGCNLHLSIRIISCEQFLTGFLRIQIFLKPTAVPE